MINLKYPSSIEEMPEGASLVELRNQKTGSYNFESNGVLASVQFNAHRHYVNALSGHLAGRMPARVITKQLNLDRFYHRSERFDYLNLFDTVSDPPQLRSGRYENSCHHESVKGTITLHPKAPSNIDSNILYPCYFDLDATDSVLSDRYMNECSKIKGFALASFTQSVRNDGKKSHPFLTPRFWIQCEFVHYEWTRRGPKTLKEAQEQGLVVERKIIRTPSYISAPDLPILYLRDAVPWGNRIGMYGQEVWWARLYSLKEINQKFTFASNFDLPDSDLIAEQLSQDIPAIYAQIRSKLKYPDEIWYNLILAGAKEIKRLDMNNIANILEIPGMIRSFDKIYKQFLSFKNGSKVYLNPATGKIIKKAACIYLGIHYGIKLTVMDIKEIIKTFRDNPSLLRQLRRRVVSYSSTTIDGTLYNCKSCMKPRSGREITDMRDICRILGIELSALNAWDLVPWSFVVDWFIPVSDILDSFENIARLESTYDLEYLLETVSREESIMWKNYRLQIKVYDRYVTDRMPLFGFSVGKPSGLNNHVIEASALIINSVD